MKAVLTEENIVNIVSETVKKVLKEYYGDMVELLFYRHNGGVISFKVSFSELRAAKQKVDAEYKQRYGYSLPTIPPTDWLWSRVREGNPSLPEKPQGYFNFAVSEKEPRKEEVAAASGLDIGIRSY